MPENVDFVIYKITERLILKVHINERNVMNNNQPQSRPNRGAPKTNPTRTYSQTKRPSRKTKAEIARRIFIAKCIIVFCFIFILGGGVFLLSRSGLFKKSSKTERTMLSSLTSQTEATPSSSAEETSDTTPEITESQGSLAGYTVILDPGHSGEDTGCGWPLLSSEIEEKDITLKIVNAMEEDLTSRGAKVYVTRRTDDTVGIYYRMAEVHLICMDIAKERGELPFSEEKEQDLRQKCEKIKQINEWQKFSKEGMGFMAGFGASDDLKLLMDMEAKMTDVVFVSIHINSTGDESEYEIKHGAAVHFSTDEYNASPSHDEGGEPRHDPYYGRNNELNSQFAQMLYDHYVQYFPDMVSYSAQQAHLPSAFAVIREQALVGVLFEVGFITNEHDRAFFKDDAKLKESAIPLDDAIEEYFLSLKDKQAAS